MQASRINTVRYTPSSSASRAGKRQAAIDRRAARTGGKIFPCTYRRRRSAILFRKVWAIAENRRRYWSHLERTAAPNARARALFVLAERGNTAGRSTAPIILPSLRKRNTVALMPDLAVCTNMHTRGDTALTAVPDPVDFCLTQLGWMKALARVGIV